MKNQIMIIVNLIFIVNHLISTINNEKILEKISCDFNDGTLCDWILNTNNEDDGGGGGGNGGSIAQFLPIFNHTELFFDDYEHEKILLIRSNPKMDIVSIESPTLLTNDHDYEFSFQINMNFIGYIQIVIRQQQIETQILKIKGDHDQKWKTYSVGLPKYHKMNILLEIKFLTIIDPNSEYIALNYVKIIDKHHHKMDEKNDNCEYKCLNSNQCLSNQSICNIYKDCPFGDDEEQNCDLLPAGSYCNFDYDFCSWYNYDEPNSSGQWIHLTNNNNHDDNSIDSGSLGVIFKGIHKFALISYLKSPLFDSIPSYHSIISSNYFNSCKVHFSYIFHTISIDLALELEPFIDDNNNNNNNKQKPIQLWRYFNNKLSSKWTNVTVTLPTNFHQRYYLKFGAALGLKSTSTFGQKVYVAIDNFSLTKSCFGIDVPENERRIPLFIPKKEQMEKFFTIPKNKSINAFTFTTCGASGNHGPTYSQCELFYLNSSTRAAVFEKNKNLNLNLNINGTQMWIVPKTGYYTIIAKGGNGGRGLYDHPGGFGSLVRAIFHFQEGDTIFLVIGHSGNDVCRESTKNFDQCKYPRKNSNKISIGGGGGGATYVFKLNPYSNSVEKFEPLLIAGGGGGGNGKFDPNFKLSSAQHGRGFDIYNSGFQGIGDRSGGGWNSSPIIQNNQTGQSLLDGAIGGLVCPQLSEWNVTGGFGGGGGGCQSGGGGGGYQGGNVRKPFDAGDGGTSYVTFNQSFLQSFSNPNMLSLSEQEEMIANGFVMVIPQIDDCCNDGQFACLITGEFQNYSTDKYCICGLEKFLPNSCIYEPPRYEIILWAALFIISIALILITFILIVFQKRNSKKKQNLQRNEPNDMYLLSNSDSTDLQLSRLRSHNIITEYNPNYEFGGSTCTLGDLPEIPREKLNLVKALGQGAFGEVYQGFLHQMPDENNDELPVAVKTLPEYSANKQAEMDFLMEALIMSKFNHRNIVRFIGICFEKMPRFIILELLSGGDLRTFLRENRSVVEKPSTLVMGDLLVMALDVACGCQYLEANHFIHRDIAARNCLLTSKIKMITNTNQSFNSDGKFDINNYKNGFQNSGIVVKIADFGMARDIYRANYYRKGGKAMLPVKWMPPEAFLDGIFTSKTDVWSFGVLLWEVMSMGYLPYPGRGNQEVMQLVTAGGRLECPNSLTPSQIYDIMMQCWNASPELRPNFTKIIENIGDCLRDPDILNIPLPIFHRSASMEKDNTLMRPPPDATDYLIPNNFGSQTNSNYSVATEKTELLSPDTCSTLSCNNDDNHNHKNFDTIIDDQQNDHSNLQQQNFDYLNQPNRFNTEIILNPNRFNNQNQSVRYVNVNVNNSMIQTKNI
ncbi:hypothetical protein DERP_002415 [Dermatophagoides pteronyssinus]|uniref:Tyrosine-protein kinase receptor n=1 Tax=Dermatophagoides pteronyssinus TaxID=6956 RepID=A0ABQ8JHN1_DERPT|nr:hypothetical protein DERP_002415 [Dermatophagoides pteronyssinus]